MLQCLVHPFLLCICQNCLCLPWFLSSVSYCFLHTGLLFLCCCSVAKSYLTLDCSVPGFSELHCLWELAQTHVRWVSNAIQPSHLLLPHSPLPGFSWAHLLFSCSVTSNSFRPHGLEHSRLPCPSLSPRVRTNACPLSWWCYLTISSSAAPFSFCLQYFPASGSFPMSQLFTSAKV